MEIEFEVEAERNNNEQQLRYDNKKLRLSSINNSPNDGPVNANANTVGYDWRDIRCKDGTSAATESHQRLLACDRVYKPQSESRLVGIYVGCQEFSRVEALYEHEVSQQV